MYPQGHAQPECPPIAQPIAKRPPEGESARDKQYDGHTELGEQEHVATRARHSRGPETVKQSLPLDRKSTRLNSSHGYISYAVFCLKKKKQSATASPNQPH